MAKGKSGAQSPKAAGQKAQGQKAESPKAQDQKAAGQKVPALGKQTLGAHKHQLEYPAEFPEGLQALGRARVWDAATLAWYADLAFVAQIGNALLIPTQLAAQAIRRKLVKNWLETEHAALVLDHLTQPGVHERPDGAFVNLLGSLLAAGRDVVWTTPTRYWRSPLYPIAVRLGLDPFDPALKVKTGRGRDVGVNLATMVYTFNLIAPPISREFKDLLALLQARYEISAGKPLPPPPPPVKEQAKIRREAMVAVDKTYAARVNEIHTPVERWDVRLGVMSADKQSISLEFKLPPDGELPLFDNIIDLIRPFLGHYGARVVQMLYEIANDPPHWRNPTIEVQTNDLLDRLGLKRDDRGIHRSLNRERLRDLLNAAHNLTIIGEYSTFEGGTEVRKAFRRTVLSLVGATFDANESATLSTRELFERGLPRSMQIRLNFYDGVRRPDGSLGDQYILMPRMAAPAELGHAKYTATEGMLRAFFLTRSRLRPEDKGVIYVQRAELLAKAGITNSQQRQATATLRKALEKLLMAGVIERYSVPRSTAQTTIIEIALTPQFLQANLGEIVDENVLDEYELEIPKMTETED